MAEKKAVEKKVDETPVYDSTTKKAEVSRWTRDLCMRFAKRFHSREEWQKGAPASFKAAVARGWADECVAKMLKAPTSIKKGVAAKSRSTNVKVKAS